MSVAVIINPHSGAASLDERRRRAERAAAVLARAGEPGEVFVTERQGHAGDLARSAVARGARLVMAWGGDGTINEVASALIHTPTALGIVPSGSGNGLARELAVARQPDRAIAEALQARPRAIDAGEFGGRTFVNMAGVAFDARIAECFNVESGSRGLANYARLTVREMTRYRCADYRVDGAAARRALLVVVANTTQFGNGARIAPKARLDDGLLDLVIVDGRSLAATLIALPRLFLGGLARLRGVTMRPVTDVTIESDAPMTFHVDGEIEKGSTRLVARVLPQALQVSVR
jgi:diacylglycerol kinase (ATP)